MLELVKLFLARCLMLILILILCFSTSIVCALCIKQQIEFVYITVLTKMMNVGYDLGSYESCES